MTIHSLHWNNPLKNPFVPSPKAKQNMPAGQKFQPSLHQQLRLTKKEHQSTCVGETDELFIPGIL